MRWNGMKGCDDTDSNPGGGQLLWLTLETGQTHTNTEACKHCWDTCTHNIKSKTHCMQHMYSQLDINRKITHDRGIVWHSEGDMSKACTLSHLLQSYFSKKIHHQWILCSEWVPSEWESEQLIKALPYKHTAFHFTRDSLMDWRGESDSCWRHPFTAEDTSEQVV